MNTADRIAALIDRLARVVRNDAERAGPGAGASALKPVHWEALRFLHRANRFSRTPGAVTAWLGVTKGTASQSLAALERHGLIDKAVDPDDRRVVRLSLTDAGTARVGDDPLAALARRIAHLDGAELEIVERVLEAAALDMLEERAQIRFGVCRTCAHFRERIAARGPDRCALLQVDLRRGDETRLCVEHAPASET